MVTPRLPVRAPRIYPDNPHVRICGGPGSATTLVYPTTPNLVWIAQVGNRVQLLHDRGHVLAHEAEDVVTEVGTVPREQGSSWPAPGAVGTFT